MTYHARSRAKNWLLAFVAVNCFIVLILLVQIVASSNRGKAGDIGLMTAYSADSFADMFGVTTHLHYGYDPTPTYFDDVIKPRLVESGIRHIRDELGSINNEHVTMNARLAELGQHGIDVLFTIDTSVGENDPNGLLTTVLKAEMYGGTITRLDGGKKTFAGGVLIEAVEGPNEQDHCPSYASCNSTPGTWWDKSQVYRPNWDTNLINYMSGLRSGLDSDPQTASLQIVGPSYVHSGEFSQVSGLTERLQTINAGVTTGNAHVYCNTLPLSSCYSDSWTPSSTFYAGKGMTVTEYGVFYENNAGGSGAVSEKVGSKYIQRASLDLFKRGVRRAYLYELWSQGSQAVTTKEGSFGLLRNDGTPREVFTALKNTIALLGDNGSTATPTNYRVEVSSSSALVKSLLLQKENGRYYLVMWYEPTSSTDSDATKSVTVNFGQDTALAILYRPGTGTEALANYANPNSIDLTIPDEPVVLEFSSTNNASSETPTPTPTPSNSGSGSTTTPTTTATGNTSGNNSNGGSGSSTATPTPSGGTAGESTQDPGAGASGGVTGGNTDSESELGSNVAGGSTQQRDLVGPDDLGQVTLSKNTKLVLGALTSVLLLLGSALIVHLLRRRKS